MSYGRATKLTGLKDTEWSSSSKHFCAVSSFSIAEICGQHLLSYTFLRSESIMRVSVLQLHSIKARCLPHTCSLLHSKRLMNDSIIKHHWHDARAHFLPVSNVGWLWCHSPIRNESVHAHMSSCKVMWDEQQGEPASATTAANVYPWIQLFRFVTNQVSTDFMTRGFGFDRIRWETRSEWEWLDYFLSKNCTAGFFHFLYSLPWLETVLSARACRFFHLCPALPSLVA